MKKEVIRSAELNEEYHVYTHASGLKLLCYPMQEFSTAYAMFGVKFGSTDTVFQKDGEECFTQIPQGVAHYLEHKLFESEEGDAFELFSQTGAYANAFTSFDKTCYLFSTAQDFEQSLSCLLQFVQHPYFTEENVLRERGIIAQEIQMYQDNPSWRVYFHLLQAMYQKHPVRFEVAGTVESIEQIDAELLYDCYRRFYRLSNMAVAIAGNFNEERAVKLVEENLLPDAPARIVRGEVCEPKEVLQHEVKERLPVAAPLFCYGIKERPVSEAEQLRCGLLYDLLLDVLAGDCSPLYRRLYDQGLIDTGFSTETLLGRGYCACIFGGYSKDPERVRRMIDQEILRCKSEGLDPELFDCAKRSLYGALIGGFDSAEEVAESMLSAYFSAESDVYAELRELRALTLADVQELLQSGFSLENSVMSVVLPEETAEKTNLADVNPADVNPQETAERME